MGGDESTTSTNSAHFFSNKTGYKSCTGYRCWEEYELGTITFMVCASLQHGIFSYHVTNLDIRGVQQELNSSEYTGTCSTSLGIELRLPSSPNSR